MRSKNLVYSTQTGRLCPDCNQLKADCRCASLRAAAKHASTSKDGIVRIERQVKGRAGKPVTLISGLPLDHEALKSLAKKLKAKCGVGGSIEEGKILIQGDKRDILKTELESLGYSVKFSGG